MTESFAIFLSGFFCCLIGVFLYSKSSFSKNNKQKLSFEKEKQSIALIERYSALGDFGAGIAHEINNPLAIILGRTQGLKMKIERDMFTRSESIEVLEKIENAVKRISKIINALRIMTKDATLEEASLVSISSLIEGIETVWASRLKNNGFEFTVKNKNPELMAVVKKTQVTHALFNLISNSFEFLKDQDKKWITLEISEKNNFIQISVSDSGQGISKEIQQKIFDPFFTTKEVGKGTGLGLSIAKGCAEDNKGTLEYDQNSKNTRFIFSIPKIDESRKIAS